MPHFLAKIDLLPLEPIESHKADYEILKHAQKMEIQAGWLRDFELTINGPPPVQSPLTTQVWSDGRLFLNQPAFTAVAALLACDISDKFDARSATSGDHPPRNSTLLPVATDSGLVWQPCLPRPCHFGTQHLAYMTSTGGPYDWTLRANYLGRWWEANLDFSFHITEHPQA